jgi:hypothetical protein
MRSLAVPEIKLWLGAPSNSNTAFDGLFQKGPQGKVQEQSVPSAHFSAAAWRDDQTEIIGDEYSRKSEYLLSRMQERAGLHGRIRRHS